MRTAAVMLLVSGILALGLMFPAPCRAVPTQFGASGLLTQPSAETLDAGNLSFGLWLDHSDGDGGTATIVPAALTLGLGSFLEVYGSYPNLLFNDDDQQSGKGDVALGFKSRILGKRSSPFRLALDIQGRRSVSDKPGRDGINSYLGRVIASYRPERFGVHANVGYQINDDPAGAAFDDQIIAGGGIEFYPNPRARLIAEVSYATEKQAGQGEEGEATVGVQYFASPHLTLNLGVGFGLYDASPGWRVLLGMSTTQGVGTYFTPVPRVIQPPDPLEVKEEEAAGPIPLIRPLSPLLAAQARPRALTGAEKLEVPVAPPGQAAEVVLSRAERLPLEDSPAVRTRAFSAVAPMSDAEPEPMAEQAGLADADDKGGDASIQTQVVRKFRLPVLTFEFDQWSLTEEGRKAIADILESLREDGRRFLLRIDGHTDNVGSEQYNARLSLRRAISVGAHIVNHEGIDPARIFVKGFGQEQPIADNDSAEGRAANRRVEILVLVPKEASR